MTSSNGNILRVTCPLWGNSPVFDLRQDKRLSKQSRRRWFETHWRHCNDMQSHDDVIKWKHFPRNWPFVREIHRSPVNFPHKGQWRGALMFSLIYVWINDWVNNREAGDLRRQHGHYDVIVMQNYIIITIGYAKFHYSDVMFAGSSQIISLTIVYSTVYSGTDQWKKTSKLRVTGLCAGNSSMTEEFPAQMAGNAENVSIWWRHHVEGLQSKRETRLKPCLNIKAVFSSI